MFAARQTQLAKLRTKRLKCNSLFYDLCCLKHSELAEHLLKYKGRVVLCGDSLKDEDAKQCSPNTEHPRDTATAVLATLYRPPGMARAANDVVSACTSQNEGCSEIAQASGDGMRHNVDTAPFVIVVQQSDTKTNGTAVVLR